MPIVSLALFIANNLAHRTIMERAIHLICGALVLGGCGEEPAGP